VSQTDSLDTDLMEQVCWSDVLFRSALRDVQKHRFSNAANERATERAWRAVAERWQRAKSLSGSWQLFSEAVQVKLGHV
jgi:hypothetical protein